jgi:hypothetical protein
VLDESARYARERKQLGKRLGALAVRCAATESKAIGSADVAARLVGLSLRAPG